MPRHGRARVEWPSIALCTGIHGAFLACTWFAAVIPAWLFVALLGPLLAWHSSMQHEFIHGHPTPNARLNRALAFAPLSFWLPFETYRRSHLRHHRDDSLTDPLDDPESYYWSPQQWGALSPVGRVLVRAHTTLAGRLLIGPAWNISRFLRSEWRQILSGDRLRRRIWKGHGLACLGLLAWLACCHVNLIAYVVAVYTGTALLLLRSFAEHRAHAGVFERTAIVENAWLLGPLFLFNNLHAAHHERPSMPWYGLPRWYRENRAWLVGHNGGLVYNGYADVARRYLLRPHDAVIHPFGPGPQPRRPEAIANQMT